MSRQANTKAKKLSSDEAKKLVKETYWEDREIKALHAIFIRYQDGTNVSSVERLRDMPETSSVPLFHRVLTMHNKDLTGNATFGEFAHAMSALSLVQHSKKSLSLPSAYLT